MIVLDTNVVSALMTARDDGVDAWLDTVPRQELFTTVITRAEIRYGLARLPEGRRRDDLTRRADALFDEVADRTLIFGLDASDRYGELVAARERSGAPISVPDAQIASIAFVHRASVATRNTQDFRNCGIDVINPFTPNESRA